MPILRPEVDFNEFRIADVPARHEPFRLINRIPIMESGEPIVDLRVTCPEFSFSTYCLPYVRAEVADALAVALEKLPSHLDLRMFTALRTLEQQAEMYWLNYNKAKEEHPNWPESVLRKMTNRFFAPPDAKAPPGHCTGGAVDVGLFNRETGEAVDLRSPLEGWESAPTSAHGLSEEATENRRLLCCLMHSTGLSNCRDEFWHWSYGDSAWAVRVGARAAPYGLIEPPEGHTRVTGAKVVIHEYNPSWPDHFAEIHGHLLSALGELAISVEHVGSTSVPGLAAKPIIDIDVVIEKGEALTSVVESLATLGFEHQGDLGVAGREAFKTKDDSALCKSWPAHHLYVCEKNNAELARHLAFRDYLRANQAAAVRYAEIKRDLAQKFPWDRIRYNDGKAPFVSELLAECDMIPH